MDNFTQAQEVRIHPLGTTAGGCLICRERRNTGGRDVSTVISAKVAPLRRNSHTSSLIRVRSALKVAWLTDHHGRDE